MKVQGIAYITPVVRFDVDKQVVVVQRRDSDTGKVSIQFPSERVIRERATQPLPPVQGADKTEAVAVKRVAEPPLRRADEAEVGRSQGVSIEA